ncbi:MAG: PqqD family protein [Bacteroidales bacterium]|nr:PqqD family protein [Bacteroidales bacterium]
MRINPRYKVRNVADENIVLVQGRNTGDMTTVIALNETSLYLWNQLQGSDFEISDICKLLVDRYEVDATTAETDAEKWVATLKEHNILDK